MAQANSLHISSREEGEGSIGKEAGSSLQSLTTPCKARAPTASREEEVEMFQ